MISKEDRESINQKLGKLDELWDNLSSNFTEYQEKIEDKLYKLDEAFQSVNDMLDNAEDIFDYDSAKYEIYKDAFEDLGLKNSMSDLF